MDDIKWIEPITCKECALEFNKAWKFEVEKIVEDRLQRQKCRGCYKFEGEHDK